jgi:hypothetical protein
LESVKMTLDELRAKLDELGIPHDKWGHAGGKTVESPMIERHKALLVKVQEMLERQVEADKNKISELHTVLQRAKHGGGV